MSSGKKIPLTRAEAIAKAICNDLAPGCQRIEIAGSIRRRRPEVGDIEIVAIPKYSADLLGDNGYSMLDPILDDLVERNFITTAKWGEKYKQFILKGKSGMGLQVDLFLCNPQTWAMIFMIRTGPAEFSHRLVTQRSIGGLLPSFLKVKDGLVWNSEKQIVPLKDERDVFRLIELPYKEPWER